MKPSGLTTVARAHPRRYLPTPPEMAAVFGGCLLLGLVTFWPQLTHAAFYRDDWGFAQFYLAHSHDFLSAAVNDTIRINRPVYWGYEYISFGLFGLNPTPQEIVTLILAAVYSTLTFAFLRVAGLRRTASTVVAVLLIIFPLSNSTRLLPSTGTTTLGAVLFLAGATLALATLRADQPSRLNDVASRLLYCLSLLAYQSTTAFIFLSFLVYRLVVPWGVALRRWRRDLLYVGTFYVLFTVLNYAFGNQIVAVTSATTWPRHAARIAAEAAGVMGLAAIPQGRSLVTATLAVERAIGIAVVFAAVVGLNLRLVRQGGDGEQRRVGEHWLRIIALCIPAIALAYLVFVPADYVGYHPLARGQGNRINHFAAVPMLLTVYALLVLAVNLLPLRFRSSTAVARTIPALLSFVLAAAYVVADRGDITRWQATAASQRQMAATLSRNLPRGNAPITVAVFGPLNLVNADVPHSSDNLPIDLEGTFAVPLRRSNVRAYLIGAETPFECGATRMLPVGHPANASAYGATAFLRPLTNSYSLITDRATCLRLAPVARG